MDLICKDIDAYFDLPLVCIFALQFLSQESLCVKFNAMLWPWFDRTAGVDLLLWINIYKRVKQHCSSHAMARFFARVMLTILFRDKLSIFKQCSPWLLPVSRRTKQLPFWVYFTAIVIVLAVARLVDLVPASILKSFRKLLTEKLTFISPFQWTFMSELRYLNFRILRGWGWGPPFTNSEYVIGSLHVMSAEPSVLPATLLLLAIVNQWINVEYADVRQEAWAVDSTSGMPAGQINNLCGWILYTDKHKVVFSSPHCS